MDERLSKALEFGRYQETIQNQKKLLKNKMTSMLNYSTNGGTFDVNPSLIVYVKTLVDSSVDNAIILDRNDNPIMISDLTSFYDDILSLQFEVLNEYHANYEKLRSTRTLSKLLEDN